MATLRSASLVLGYRRFGTTDLVTRAIRAERAKFDTETEQNSHTQYNKTVLHNTTKQPYTIQQNTNFKATNTNMATPLHFEVTSHKPNAYGI